MSQPSRELTVMELVLNSITMDSNLLPKCREQMTMHYGNNGPRMV